MLSRTVGFYTVKVSAIFLMSFFYFIIGSVLSVLLNDIIPDTSLEELSTPYLMAFLGTVFGCIGVVFYMVRILVKRMPFVLDGMFGFKYSLLREAAGGIIIGYTMYAFLDKLKKMMVELGGRFHPRVSQTAHISRKEECSSPQA